MKQINTTTTKETALCRQLNRLEQQFEQGLLMELSQRQRDQIERQLCDIYDIDDINLLLGTELGNRYLHLRKRMVDQALSQPIVAA